jgi:hypothetical protein
MTDVPVATPVTKPVKPTVATAVLVLLQVPPGVISVSGVVLPAHTVRVPAIVAGCIGCGFTVMGLMAVQPVGNVYKIAGVPAATAVTIPVDPTMARAVLLLLHAPPEVRSVNGTVNPAHSVFIPEIADGTGFTVTPVVVAHPVGNVYVMITLPADIPAVKPVDTPTVAMAVLLLLQAPPPPSANSVVEPTHTTGVPVVAAGNGLTVTTVVASVPQPVE